MRIAIFTEYYYPFVSGVVTHIETLKSGLEAKGHEVMIVTLDPRVKENILKDGILYCPAIELKRIYGYGMANPLNLKRLEILRRFGPDIIHIHTEFTMGIFGMFAAKRLHKPVVYTLHTMYDDYLFYVAPRKSAQKLVKPAAHAFFRRVANNATEVIGPSEKVVEFLRRCDVHRHVNIIPNIVDLSEFLPQNVAPEAISAARAELGLSEGDTALLFVGRLGKEKSIDVLIEDFTLYFSQEKNCKLFIIGDGPEKENLAKQIRLTGLSDRIRMLGRVDHDKLPPYYQACDLFATASLSEMNSISMLEAMASGLYVLQRLDIYNVGQIDEGVDGNHFTTAGEFAALVKEEQQLSAGQRMLRREGVTRSSQKYGTKEFIARILNVYERALDEFPAK